MKIPIFTFINSKDYQKQIRAELHVRQGFWISKLQKPYLYTDISF